MSATRFRQSAGATNCRHWHRRRVAGWSRRAVHLGRHCGRQVRNRARITRFDPDRISDDVRGRGEGFRSADRMGRKDARRTDRYTHFAVASALEALEHAGLAIDEAIADRVGVLIGSGMGGAETLDAGMETVLTEGPSRLSPFFMPMFLGNMASGTVAIATGARGPNFAPVSACASSAHAIGEAAAIIRRGEADVMIAGGSEAPLARMVVAGFNAMGALSTRNDDPAAASRPFDAERDGFVLGEGGAALILESARACGAAWRDGAGGIDRVWDDRRCEPHGSAGARWERSSASDDAGAGRRRPANRKTSATSTLTAHRRRSTRNLRPRRSRRRSATRPIACRSARRNR